MKRFTTVIFVTFFLNNISASGPGASSGTNAQPASEPGSTDIMGGGTPGGEQHHGIKRRPLQEQQSKQDRKKDRSSIKNRRPYEKRDSAPQRN